MRMVRWMATAAVAAVLLVGCGGGSGSDTETTRALPQLPREVQITLDGYPGPENVGILMAEQRGYFEDVGLEVWVRTPVSQLRPVRYVAEGEVDLSISHEPQVEMAREKGVPVVSIGSLISQPTAAMIWLRKSGIRGIADLKGKTIAIPGLPFQRDLLQSVLAREDLTLDDVKVVFSDYELVPDLVSGRADAIFGGSWNLEGRELQVRGLKPVITRVQDLGTPSYDEFVLIARPHRLARDPQLFRDFTAAVARGTAAAVEDPESDRRILEVSEKKTESDGCGHDASPALENFIAERTLT